MLTVRQDAKTTIDTVSAVRRRLESAAAPVRQFRLAWIGALFVVVALLALLLGRGLKHRGDGTAHRRPSGVGARSAGDRLRPGPQARSRPKARSSNRRGRWSRAARSSRRSCS